MQKIMKNVVGWVSWSRLLDALKIRKRNSKLGLEARKKAIVMILS